MLEIVAVRDAAMRQAGVFAVSRDDTVARGVGSDVGMLEYLFILVVRSGDGRSRSFCFSVAQCYYWGFLFTTIIVITCLRRDHGALKRHRVPLALCY